MNKDLKVNIKFLDLDVDKEIYFTEETLQKANPLLTPKKIIYDTPSLNGLLLTFKEGVKRIVQINIDFEDKFREERTITIKIQDMDKSSN